MNGGAPAAGPRVAVLMAAFENARFLPEQLASIRAQDHANIALYVSRDCDTPEMGRVLAEHASAFGPERFFVRPGPRKGCAANFLSLAADPRIEADYFAYSDQDDVWEPDKISRAIAALEGGPADAPALYGARSRLIDENGRGLGLAPWHGAKPPSFPNALAQNILNGHTMVMNRAARDLVRAAGAPDVPYHDWWTYMLVSGAGGRIVCDSRPSVRHRQHAANRTGAARRARDFIRRLRAALNGEMAAANAANLRALRRARGLLSPGNRRILDACGAALHARPPARIWTWWRLGAHRRSYLRNIHWFLALSARRV